MSNWWQKALGKVGREQATNFLTQGFVHAKNGALDAACESYQAAVDADGTLATAHLNLGLSLVDLYNRDMHTFDAAAHARALDGIAAPLERALVLDPKAHVAWRALARTEERRGRFARAEEAWLKAEETSERDSPAFVEARKARGLIARRAKAARAKEAAVAALALSEVSDATTAACRAAIDALLPLLSSKQENAGLLQRAHVLAGSLAHKLDDLPLAREQLEHAVVEQRDDVEALRELALVCIAQKDLARAVQASLEAYRCEPTDPGLVCNVGVCFLGLGDVEQAGEYIALAEQLAPKDPIVQRAKAAVARARAEPTPAA